MARCWSWPLFSALFPRYVALHFLGLWLVFLFWVWLQGADFMPGPHSEWLYRATVATILYFSWFNVAEEATPSRATIHLVNTLRPTQPSPGGGLGDSRVPGCPVGALLQSLLPATASASFWGWLCWLAYYCWLHLAAAGSPDQVDGTWGLRSLERQLPQNRHGPPGWELFPKLRNEAVLPWKGEVNGVL